MKYTVSNIAGGVEILAADDFVGLPIKVAGASLVKAGTPLTSAGAASSDGAGAAGILLYDVDPTVNPNGTIVVQGVIDATKAQAHSGLTYDVAALKTAVPGLVLRTNIGTNV